MHLIFVTCEKLSRQGFFLKTLDNRYEVFSFYCLHVNYETLDQDEVWAPYFSLYESLYKVMSRIE